MTSGSVIVLALLFSLCAAKHCNEYTNCDSCNDDLLCQWCGKDYYSAPGRDSNCHALGSPYGCASWIRQCGSIVPLTNETVFDSPYPRPLPVLSPSITADAAITPSAVQFPHITVIHSPAPTEDPSRSRLPEIFESPWMSTSPAESASVSKSISISPSSSVSISSSETRSISPSISVSPTTSMLCPAFYWTDCEKEHPGCREGFTRVNSYTAFEAEDSNGWRQSICLWPLWAHWKCCMDMPDARLIQEEEDEAPKVVHRFKPHHVSIAAPLMLVGTMALAMFAVLAHRYRITSLASQDQTRFEDEVNEPIP